MRPIRLDIAGFAAFRDPVMVDFADADYFALTGPTGAGKSTVIDAMTFALYGSAPRWGRENAIQYALAPTANRCTVRLVFDLAGQRYAAAREVRRSGKQIAQKNPRLERYLDAGATGDPQADEPTESLAADARAMKTEIADLLGLDFEDFCTCVVLPQGDFAAFLSASVAERQAILLKLLGARHYEALGRMAGRRASDASARIEALQGQLSGYGDATAEHEAAARDQEERLAALTMVVADEVARLTTALTERAESAGRAARRTTEVALLDAVAAPHDIADLQWSLAAADTAYTTASLRERDAAAALARAEAALSVGPRRAPLEETLRWYAEWSTISARLPGAGEVARRTAAAVADAGADAAGAERALDGARGRHDQDRAAREEAATAVAEVERHLVALDAVAVPDGTADLDRAAAADLAAAAQAAHRLDAADAAVAEATAAVSALPERSALAQLERTIGALADTAAQLTDLLAAAEAAAGDLADAERAVVRAVSDEDQAHTDLERLRTRSAAADLRPHLQVGHACPVCDQTVATLPARLDAPALDAARAALLKTTTTRQAVERAAAERRTAVAELRTRIDAARARSVDLDQTLAAELPGPPSGVDRDPVGAADTVAALLSDLEAAQAHQQTVLRERSDAQRAVRVAEEGRQRTATQTQQSWARLHATVGQLSAFGPPPVTTTGLAEAWSVLVDWSVACTDRLRTTDLVAARAGLETADRHLAAAATVLDGARDAARAATERHRTAAVAADRARAEHDDLVRRRTELEALLADRPTESETRHLLAEHEGLSAAASDARRDALASAQARHDAEAARDLRRADRDLARAALHRARESLVALGAPPIDDADLRTAWTELVEWAGDLVAAHRSEIAALQQDIARLDDALGRRSARLDETLVAHGLGPLTPVASGSGQPGPAAVPLVGAEAAARLRRLPTDVELALERARALTATIGRRRREAEELRRTIAADEETAVVARQLALLMSAKRFPQWLADAALDTLVADASRSLLALSGGQFELTHEKGEFYVVDHADADSLRSVKTLSGGETFQASLALALALSDQLSTLAAGGRTTLDSIFLDEGFGTLDPDALEVVASTLENLAQGNRMVGVVTHVAALAERVPVRFEVTRDSRTSTIERVGA